MASAPAGDLNDLAIFTAVVDTGGFTAAAERLGVTKARVSVAVRRLEAGLGVSLLTRTTRRVVPTEAGRRLHGQCAPLLAGVAEAIAEVGGEHATVAGTLKIAAPVDHTVQCLAGLAAEFARRHPRLRVNLCASDHIVDMVAEGVDLSIRVGWLRDSTQRAVKLGEFEQYVVAAPAYLRAHGTPQEPQDLVRHAWIALSLLPAPLTWTFTAADGGAVETVRMTSRLQTDSPAALRALLEGGAGISVMETLGIGEALVRGRLQRLLPGWTLPRGGIYAVTPPGRHPPASVRAFVAFYRERLGLRCAVDPHAR